MTHENRKLEKFVKRFNGYNHLIPLSHVAICTLLLTSMSPSESMARSLINTTDSVDPSTEFLLTAEDNVLKGLVKDTNGEPIIGANVLLKGEAVGAITDLDGKFQLNVPKNSTLVITYIGYKTQEIRVGNKTELNIVLEEESQTLDDIVVVGFGTQKKANLTGAVSSVKMDEVLGNRPVAKVSTALMGAMPGLQVTGSNGKPGSGMSFNIRGVNSINSGSPLILVDNVEMDINMLDPNDIESVSVLKDAASSAIYGARAAFGVVLITTKKGSQDSRFSVNYSNNFSFSKASNLPKKATPLQTVQGYKDMGVISYATGQDVDVWLGMLKEYEKNPSAYPMGYGEKDGLQYSLKETDLLEDMLETGFQQTHNIAINGGSKNISYRMSAGMVDQDGILVTNKDSYKRYNISSYIRSDASKWLTPELDIKYGEADSKMPYTSANYGIWGAAVAFPSYFPLDDMEIGDEVLPVNSPRNFIQLAAPKTNKKTNLRIFGKVTVTPFKDLKIIGEYTYNRQTTEGVTFDKKFDYAHGLNFRKEQSVSNSKYSVSNGATDYTAFNVYGNYNKKIGKHDIAVMAGFNQESKASKSVSALRMDMINEDLPSLSQGTGDYKNSDSYSEYHVRGLFYRLNYTFAGKYLLETNGRYDGSSKFPKNSRFGFFPSVSVGWRLSEEKFMDWSKSVVSNFKLRGSYGNIGNQSINPYQFVPGMHSSLAHWIVNGQSATTLLPPDLVSDNFTWEKVGTLDFGFDLSLFNNRLSTVFDWYNRTTKGMLAPGMELPGALGAAAPMQNTADLRARGWELSVDWHDKIGKVNYYLGFNLYDSKSEITKYDNEAGLLGKYYKGEKLGSIWGFVTDRLYSTDDFDEAGKLKPGLPKVEGYNPKPGDILYKDLNGDGIINGGKNTLSEPGDKCIIGNNKRRYQYGIRGGASWKGISCSFILQGVGKRDLSMMNELYYPFFDSWSTLFDTQLDYWTPENPNSFFPRIYEKAEGNTGANKRTQTRFLQDGSYLSLRNLTLSYNFPAKWLKPWGISNLSVFFSGENLCTFDHLPKGMDAERAVTNDLGARGFTYPYTRQYSFGINLSL